uniref:Uncharacterized protein n=1 Tax=Fagus sylvatica TaxID=28930 RepID=A0A2N9HZA6_FAGSY
MCNKEACSVSKNHRQRWRMAFTVIYFTRVLVSMSKKDLDKKGPPLATLSHVSIAYSVSKNHRQRWRMAFTVIYFTRVLVSMSKKVHDKKGPSLGHPLSRFH